MIRREIVRRIPLRIHTARGNACRSNPFQHLHARIALGKNIRLEKEATLRHTAQDLRPYAQDMVIDLGKVIKAAEHNAAAGSRRMQGGRRRVERLPAEMRRGENEQFLGKALLRISCGKDGIGEEVIHRSEPRGGEIADARDLDGRGTIGENWQRTARRMPRKVDEDVDPVAIDRIRCLLRGEARQIAKVLHRTLDLLRIGVLRAECIDGHRKARRVERCHQRIRKREHHMLSDIGREIPDAEPLPSSVCTVIKRLNRRKETAVLLCRLPILCGRSRKIVTVKEHIARIECTQREIWRGIARTRIEPDGLIRSPKKACALPREIIDLLRDLRRHGRIEKRRQCAQRRSALSHKEVDACTQEDRIGLVRRTRPALLPRL